MLYLKHNLITNIAINSLNFPKLVTADLSYNPLNPFYIMLQSSYSMAVLSHNPSPILEDCIVHAAIVLTQGMTELK